MRAINFPSIPAILAASALLVANAPGQDAVPQPPNSARPPANASSDAAAAAEAPANTANSALNFAYKQKPGEGTAAAEAFKANSVMGDRALAADALGFRPIPDPNVRDQFEKFLGMSRVTDQELASYQDTYDLVQDHLRESEPVEAWKQLHVLAEYPIIDAGFSRELANRIEAFWNAGRTATQVTMRNRDLREEAATANYNVDVMAEATRFREQQIQASRGNKGKASVRQQTNRNQQNDRGGQGGGGAESAATGIDIPMPDMGAAMGKMRLTEEYMRSLEAKAQIKLNEMEMRELNEKVKNDFASYISGLFEGGRFRHVILAADFYRVLFNHGDYPVAIAQQVNQSLEVSRDVQTAVDVFNYKLGRGELASATERLQEAFSTSSYHPALLEIERDDKQQVEEFHQLLSKMQNMIEARDFNSLQPLLVDIQEKATDYDATKPAAIINGVKLQSQMSLGSAKLAAQQGDIPTAMEHFRAAGEAWPGNPDLQKMASQFFETHETVNQAVEDFDRMYAANDYRGIFDNQLAIAPALKDDSERQDQMRQVVERVKAAEIAVEKANAMRNNGDFFGAWETVEIAVREFPNDIKLNALRGELAGRGAEFVAAINKAKEAEAREDLGYSLTWYAIAQRHYPPSEMANEALERLSKQVLNDSSL